MYQLGDTSPFFPLLRQVFIQESAIQEQLINGATTTAAAPAPTPAPTPAPAPTPTAPILVPTTAPAPTTTAAPVAAMPLDVYEYRYQPEILLGPAIPFVETYPTRSGEVVPEPRPAPDAPDGTLLWIVAAGFGLFIMLGQRKKRR